MSDTTPKASIERASRRASLLWVVPIVAIAALAAFLLVQVRAERGPRIRITFTEGSGLEPGADLVHRGLSVGVVRTIELSPDLDAVVVGAELAPHAAGLAREGTRFWIVRPEVGLGGVSGLETLLGPRYIAVRPAESPGEQSRRFDGLASPPTEPSEIDHPGFPVRLVAKTAGSIVPGSAVLYRGIRVGQVTRLRLADTASQVEIDALIQPRYAPLVRDNTRFWDASGVGVDFGWFRGLSVEAGSIDSVLRGAIGLATPNQPGERVEPGRVFEIETSVDSKWLGWSPEILLDTPGDR